jgi:toxin ParE1/3/4
LIVEVSARARAEFAAAVDYLLDENPRAAERINAAIERAIGSLADMPGRGRNGRIDGTRELIVRGAPYLVVYSVGQVAVTVLSIRHTSRGEAS